MAKRARLSDSVDEETLPESISAPCQAAPRGRASLTPEKFQGPPRLHRLQRPEEQLTADTKAESDAQKALKAATKEVTDFDANLLKKAKDKDQTAAVCGEFTVLKNRADAVMLDVAVPSVKRRRVDATVCDDVQEKIELVCNALGRVDVKSLGRCTCRDALLSEAAAALAIPRDQRDAEDVDVFDAISKALSAAAARFSKEDGEETLTEVAKKKGEAEFSDGIIPAELERGALRERDTEAARKRTVRLALAQQRDECLRIWRGNFEAMKQGLWQGVRGWRRNLAVLLQFFASIPIESSLLKPLPSALGKMPANRGNFDDLVVQELEARLDRYLASLDAKLVILNKGLSSGSGTSEGLRAQRGRHMDDGEKWTHIIDGEKCDRAVIDRCQQCVEGAGGQSISEACAWESPDEQALGEKKLHTLQWRPGNHHGEVSEDNANHLDVSLVRQAQDALELLWKRSQVQPLALEVLILTQQRGLQGLWSCCRADLDSALKALPRLRVLSKRRDPDEEREEPETSFWDVRETYRPLWERAEVSLQRMRAGLAEHSKLQLALGSKSSSTSAAGTLQAAEEAQAFEKALDEFVECLMALRLL